MPDLSLNKEQERAVRTTDGPVLVIAGAGAGKTKVITERVRLLIESGVSPELILAVTFTNKAAGEMRERIFVTPPTPLTLRGAPFIGTFHALGLLLIKENLERLGVPKNFTIIDEDDAIKLIKDSLTEIGKDPKDFEPARFKNQISGIRNRLITEEEFVGEGFIGEVLGLVWKLYEKKKKQQNFLDFDDMLLKPALLLMKDKEARENYQSRWQYIHIDEYQDTNEVQYTLSKILAGKHRNILAVGDVDQAIYSWRGADFKNILNFKQDYPDAEVITLEKNYRSTDIILEAANSLILNNKMRLPKKLWTEKKGASAIKIIFAEDERKEAEMVANEITALRKSDFPGKSDFQAVTYGKMAVLYRTNAQSRAVEEVFLKKNIPYRIIGGVRFYERRETKDILAYIRFALNENDEVSKKRILNVPPRGIGKTLMQKILTRAILKPEEERKYADFIRLISEIKDDASKLPLREFLKNIIKRTGYRGYIDDGTQKGSERWQNVGELLNIADKISSALGRSPTGEAGGKVEDFLEHVALFAVDDKYEPDKEKARPTANNIGGRVSLMTMHAAKGLEFDAVFVVGLEEGLFPHSLSVEPGDLEEERRLCYVAITRAKTHLYLTYAARRTLFGERAANLPSRFLKEIPEHLAEYIASQNNTDEDGFSENIIEY
ncbi:MAG: 3'-5' exonuclease [bacterium]|nr:3'-5' exonuclease [bacterium]